jgi:formylmethanofuran--tetrahydromethanopterin N-formyltransferase
VATGYATSVIACDAEAGVERDLLPGETPDGRPGVSVLVFGFTAAGLGKALVGRVGQCVMTCPTTACFDGLPGGEEKVKVGGALRFFGDGFQSSKKLDGRRMWRVPVMDGEFVCDETFGVQRLTVDFR